MAWINLTEARAYFITRAGSTAWDELQEKEKTAFITTAENRIKYHKDFSVPATLTGDELVKIQIAVCELALYLIINLEDESRRLALQAQSVDEAGMIKEKYTVNLDAVPLPGFVRSLLIGYGSQNNVVFSQHDISRVD